MRPILPLPAGPPTLGGGLRTTTMRIRVAAVAAVALAAGCGDGATDPDVLLLVISPPQGLAVGIGGTMRFHLEAFGEGGVEIDADGAVWESADPSIATVDSGVARAEGEGVTAITARLGSRVASAPLEVWVPESVEGPYEAGVSYFGRNDYVEYVPGTLPVVLSAPHGGSLTPLELPDRAEGISDRDTNTLELTLAVRDALLELTGAAPHVVVSHLHRAKLDPNREIVEAAQGDPFAEQAWEEYHAFIEEARSVVGGFGGAMYFDIHGHGHPDDRLELGYLLGPDVLDGPDPSLNSLAVVQQTSIREMGRERPGTFAELIRGPLSLGGLLEDEGIASVPSPSIPSPGTDPYFSGGYSTRRHGSLADSDIVSGIQIEHHYPGIRDSEANRRAYSESLARAIRLFMLEHFGYFEP